MKLSRRDLDRAVGEGVISSSQAEELWRSFGERGKEQRVFDLPHVAYYLGALIVLFAMGVFMALGWREYGDLGLLLISGSYALFFAAAGGLLWRSGSARVPGGLLVTLAVYAIPLVIYAFENFAGLREPLTAGGYESFSAWLRSVSAHMELGALAAGILAISLVRFPFIVVPILCASWSIALDLGSTFFGGNLSDNQAEWISLVFGLAVLLASYLVDLLKKSTQDYAFWGYFFGVAAFWGSISLLKSGGEIGWGLYGFINLTLIPLSVLLDRKVFIVFGALGVFGYVGHLAWEVFEDSLLFPFALSGVGLATIALGILYARNRRRVERTILGFVPEGVRGVLPPGR